MPVKTDSQPVTLYVDLDGTLMFSDCLYESFLRLLRLNPFSVFLVVGWLIKGGREYMKAEIAARVDIDVTTLPYNAALIEWLHVQKTTGRQIILATASHRKYAEAVAAHLGLFDRVLASDERVNLKGIRKAQCLIAESGEGGFDYAGDSRADLQVWKSANAAVIVSTSRSLVHSVESLTHVERHFPVSQHRFSFTAMRPHQWLKNMLIFVPLLTSHEYLHDHPVFAAIIAFISMSLCASSVYIFNDLLDIEEDRQHHRKQHRPFAAGTASILGGILEAGFLLLAAFLLALWVGRGFAIWLGIYYALTLGYSLYLKRIMLIDILLLAGLYTVRIIAGAEAIRVPTSVWLLAFSMLFFLSLSMVKRYVDLVALKQGGHRGLIPGRQYHTDNAQLIQRLGLAFGYLAVVVLGFFIASDDVSTLYSRPWRLWMAVPLVFLWVSEVWWSAHRGRIHSDPVLFVIEDRFSQLTLALLILVVVLAT